MSIQVSINETLDQSILITHYEKPWLDRTAIDLSDLSDKENAPSSSVPSPSRGDDILRNAQDADASRDNQTSSVVRTEENLRDVQDEEKHWRMDTCNNYILHK